MSANYRGAPAPGMARLVAMVAAQRAELRALRGSAALASRLAAFLVTSTSAMRRVRTQGGRP